jgi:hypothetical protein
MFHLEPEHALVLSRVCANVNDTLNLAQVWAGCRREARG